MLWQGVKYQSEFCNPQSSLAYLVRSPENPSYLCFYPSTACISTTRDSAVTQLARDGFTNSQLAPVRCVHHVDSGTKVWTVPGPEAMWRFFNFLGKSMNQLLHPCGLSELWYSTVKKSPDQKTKTGLSWSVFGTFAFPFLGYSGYLRISMDISMDISYKILVDFGRFHVRQHPIAIAASLAFQLLRGCHEVNLDAILRLLDTVGGSVLLLERDDMVGPKDQRTMNFQWG